LSSSGHDDGASAGALVPHPRPSASSTQVRFESRAHAHTRTRMVFGRAASTRHTGAGLCGPSGPCTHAPTDAQTACRHLASARDMAASAC
jgi:hypothetical protein